MSEKKECCDVKWESIADDCGDDGKCEGHSLWFYDDALWRLNAGGAVQQSDEAEEAPEPVMTELWKLPKGSKIWERVACTGSVPHALTNAVVSPVGNGDKVVVFGGLDEFSDELFSNALHILDMKSFKWTIPEVSGEGPSPRDKMMACTLGADRNLLLIFGGFGPITREQAEIVRKKRRIAEVQEDGGDEQDLAEAEEDDDDADEEDGGADAEGAQLLFTWFNDSFVLDCSKMEWHKCVPPKEGKAEVPMERCAAGMCSFDDEHALLFGGKCIDGDRSNDCWQGTVAKDGTTIEWNKLDTSNAPAERSFPTMVSLQEGEKKYAVVCGGLSNNQSYFGDVCVLNIAELKWVQHSGLQGFTQRENHRAVVMNNAEGSTMVVYGGGSVIDTHTGAPTQLLSDTMAINMSKLLSCKC